MLVSFRRWLRREKGGRCGKSERRENEPARAQDKTERENTKLLLLVTLKRPVSSTHYPPAPFPSLPPPPLAFPAPPVYFDWAGKGSCITCSVLSFFLLSCLTLVSLPSLLTLKKTQKEQRSRNEIFSVDISALSCFRVDSLLPQSLDFINKWSTVASSTALPPVYIFIYMWLSCSRARG